MHARTSCPSSFIIIIVNNIAKIAKDFKKIKKIFFEILVKFQLIELTVIKLIQHQS